MQVLNMLNWVQVVDHAPCSALSVWKTSLTGLDLPVKKRVRVQSPTCSVLNQEAVLSLEARSVGEFLLVLVSIPRLTECASGVKKRNTVRKFVHFTAALFPTWPALRSSSWGIATSLLCG